MGISRVVHREPKKYHADHPFRAVATFGGKKYGFVLDKQTETRKGYDRLYFDLNGNGDLTDDVPIDVPEALQDHRIRQIGERMDRHSLPVSPCGSQDSRRRNRMGLFVLPYAVIMTTHGKDVYFRRGCSLRYIGKGRSRWKEDNDKSFLLTGMPTVDSMFPLALPAMARVYEDFIAQYGTEILFDPDVLIDKHLGYGYMSEHRQFLAEMNALGGRFYKIKVTPGRR